jgi:hypothetical protein
MWRRRLRAKEGSQLISGQEFSSKQRKKKIGLKTLRAAGRRPLQLQERGRDPTERASAQDFSGDWVLDRESWVDLEM